MKRIIILIFLIYSSTISAQDSTLVLSYDMFNELGEISLATKDTWLFKTGRDSTYTKANAKDWIKLKPSEINAKLADENGRFEGWFRIKIKLDETFKDSLAGLNFSRVSWAPMDLFINRNLLKSYGQTGLDGAAFKPYKHLNKTYTFVNLQTDKTYNILLFVADKTDAFDGELKASRGNLSNFIVLGNSQIVLKDTDHSGVSFFSTLLGVLTFLFWALYFQNKRERQLLYPTITITLLFVVSSAFLLNNLWTFMSYQTYLIVSFINSLGFYGFLFSIPLTVVIIFKNTIPKTIWIVSSVFFTLLLISNIFYRGKFIFLVYIGIAYVAIVLVYYLARSWKTLQGPKRAFVIGIGIFLLLFSVMLALVLLSAENAIDIVNIIGVLAVLSFPISLLVYILLWLKESQKEKEKNVSDLIKITQEKKELLENQNTRLEKEVTERTAELNKSLQNLKSTQAQLIQSEKMASLGELTAGIAHEIQNPLNFVNNFSEVSSELVDEIKETRTKIQESRPKTEEDLLEDEILEDIKQNLAKIYHHGRRADAIVKGMLAHSRSSSGEKVPTDLNALADEYLRLSYHGLRAKDKSFNADFSTDLDPTLQKVNVVPQDIGRVLLNLINNAFQAVNGVENAKVTVATKQLDNVVQITVSDNGPGIPDDIKDKIFQPFFTTKPTGEGTGLGLSLSYDIVKAHGGKLKVESKERTGSTFIIQLPLTKGES